MQILIPEVDEYMRNLRQQRLSDLIEDRLLMLAHPPCLAVGARRLNPADLLKPKDEFEKADIPLYQSSRGGGLTFHWPGQLVVYPVLKLAKSEQSLPKFMHRLEEVGLRTLSELGIAAYRRRHEAPENRFNGNFCGAVDYQLWLCAKFKRRYPPGPIYSSVWLKRGAVNHHRRNQWAIARSKAG
jgi:hypothetical protein